MFLPITLDEVKKLGCERPDFILVTGDAYVDHPSYGAAIIGRLLESEGFVVGIIAQPDWKKVESFKIFGMPRLAFLVTGGNIDSMVNHYTVARKKRDKDVYSPGGENGLRPDRSTIVYSNKIREAYKDAAIVIGGLEASLRRLSHYDYWDNKVRRSILLDSSADLLVYGMGESQMKEIARRLGAGDAIAELNDIRGTVYKTKNIGLNGTEKEVDKFYGKESVRLPHFDETVSDKDKYTTSFMLQYENTDPLTAKTLIEQYKDVFVVQNPPALWLDEKELDKSYEYPYMRTYHPSYEEKGGVPAINEVEFSITSCRGCFGNCSFCALSFHQGRIVQARSHDSIMAEAAALTRKEGFKGYIHDVGGPSANFRFAACKKQLTRGACKNKQCLYPSPCENLTVSHADYLSLLRKLRSLPNVKKVFVRSGIRFDYVMADKKSEFLRELVTHHVSGQLKVAPEHVSKRVLDKMGKPGIEVFEAFKKRYEAFNDELGKKQFLVPYFISSHPGSDLRAAVELAEYLRDNKIRPEQVQDFYPTPGTLSTSMYYTQTDPRSRDKIYVAKNAHDKAMQRALLQYRLPQNYNLVKEALIKAGREDLIGYSHKCLIAPEEGRVSYPQKKRPEEKGREAKIKKKKKIRNVHKPVNKTR